MKKVPKDKKTGLPKVYVAGLKPGTAKARKSHWERTSKMDPGNPAAYEPAPGDATAKTKPSKHTLAFRAKFGEGIEEDTILDEAAETGLAAKAAKSGVPIGILRKVYNRGMAAWRTGHRPGTTPQQWAMARVNSYITKGKGTYHGADKDLREGLWANIHAKRKRGERMRKPGSKGAPTDADFKSARNEDVDPNLPKNREEGTDSLVNNYKKTTPGQAVATIKSVVKEAEYQGRDVPLGKPMKGDIKKSKVFVRNEKGNVVKVEFGDPDMSIKKHIPARKKSYCARSSGQGNLNKKTSANYWSRKAWEC
jgi:hypothetical protein